jgi:hypothetical protein
MERKKTIVEQIITAVTSRRPPTTPFCPYDVGLGCVGGEDADCVCPPSYKPHKERKHMRKCWARLLAKDAPE